MNQRVNKIGVRGRPLLVQRAGGDRQVNVIAALQAAGSQGYVYPGRLARAEELRAVGAGGGG